jgi:hypothetical protein
VVRLTLTFGLCLGGLVLAACEPDQNVDFFQEVTRDPAFPGTPGAPEDHAGLLAYAPDPNCAPNVPRKLDRKTEVRLFYGNGIDPKTVVRYAGGLKRYYDYYGVTMFTRYDPLPVPLDHAIVLNEGAIIAWMRDVAKVDPSCARSSSPTLACQQAIGAAELYNVKQFLKAYAEPAQDVINIVLLKRVASLDPSDEVAQTNWSILGLGLSEELVNSISDLGTPLADLLQESDFSPTVFIAVNLTDFMLREPDIVIAHEFGHAYTLEHLDPDDYGANLMNPTATVCDLSLNASQLTTIEQETTRYGNLLEPDRYHGVELVSLTDRMPEVLRIVRERVATAAARQP